MRNVTRVSDSVWDLTGEGLEYLLDKNGEVIAVLYNGNFMTGQPARIDPEQVTAIAA